MATGGGRTTRSSSNIDYGIIKNLALLEDGDISKLKNINVANHEDLAVLNEADIDQILGTDASSLIRRRRLVTISKFLISGGMLTTTTTMEDINFLEGYRGFVDSILTDIPNSSPFSDEARSKFRQRQQKVNKSKIIYNSKFQDALRDYFREKFNHEGALQEFLKDPVFPFFNPELPNALGEMVPPKPGSSVKKMSANIQPTDRTHIKTHCNQFCVDFTELDMSGFLKTDFDVSADVLIDTVISLLLSLFIETFKYYRGKKDRNGNFGDFGFQKETTSEASEIAQLRMQLNEFLTEVYGIGFDIHNGASKDVQITVTNDQGNQIEIGGVIKMVRNLPIKQINKKLSTNLCWFGFATVLCRQENLHVTAQTLQPALNLKTEDGKSTVQKGKLGPVANRLISKTNDYKDKFEEVNNALNVGTIRSNDAVGFWTAVMQACINAVGDRDRFAFVLTARQMWYINLKYDPEVANEDLRCKVAISDSYEVGSKIFLTTLVHFFHYIKDTEETYRDMDDTIQNNFRHDLALDAVGRAQIVANSTNEEGGSCGNDEDNDEDGSNGGGGSGGGSHDEDNKKRKDKDEDGGRGGKRSKRQKTHSEVDQSILFNSMDEIRPLCPLTIGMRKVTNHKVDAPSPSKMNCNSNPSLQSTATENPVSPEPTNSAPFVPSHQHSRIKMTDEEQMWWQRALMHFPNEHEETRNNTSTSAEAMNTVSLPSLLGRDKYGPVPYLCQIKNVRRVIGNGRCGKVLEIDWCRQKVAMKLYQGDPDNEDEEDWYGIFERERKRFLDLKRLWGTHVPALLFHNPWWTCPSLGMQLGQPVYEDVKKWDDIRQWDEADIVLMKKTLSEVRNLGWMQEDLRGLNFVRLKKDGIEYIAMVDMESIVRVDKKTR